MGSVTTLPWGRPLTNADLEELRSSEDGHRYELIDGVLVVTPAPGHLHQRISVRMTVLLHAHVPADMELLTAPFDIRPSDDVTMQPDLLLARRSELTERELPAVPVLVVEILSPSTRHIDLGLKKARYEAAGCPHYWVVDPAEPSLTAWRLRDGAYRQVAHAVGEESAEISAPVVIRITPSALVE